ncbi:hypothetical protein [Paracoccus chinensis]|uniref:hypothetical protein n=1 Tax=Paracoccus chinensis TaxID=525640 RepID=UPI0011135F07|nr:hypothetical protein [Paracoccus chinensis]
MKRKDLVVELSHYRIGEGPAGWDAQTFIFRNLEPVAARVTGARVSKKHRAVLVLEDAYEESSAWGESKLKAHLPEARETNFLRALGPAGSQRSAHGFTPGDSNMVTLLTKGVTRVSDVEFIWEWADGQKH